MIWVIACLAVASTSPLVPPSVCLAAGLAGLVAGVAYRRWPVGASVLLACGTAPLWLGALRPPVDPTAAGVALVAAALVAVAERPAVPPAVAGLVLAVGAVEGLRILALVGRPGPSAGLALSVATMGAVVAGLARGARAVQATSLGLVMAAGLMGGRVFLAWKQPPEDLPGVEAAVRAGLVEHHLAALRARPQLGLAALARAPSSHGLALALLPDQGIDALLDAGWSPDEAPLDRTLRLDVARALELRGRGGQAVRLLNQQRSDPLVAWWEALYLRQQGEDERAAQLLAHARAPGDAPVLPGAFSVGWQPLRNGALVLDVQAEGPIVSLGIRGSATAYMGAPRLGLEVDAADRVHIELPVSESLVEVAMSLPAGPHRLVLRFEDDLVGPGGDRNLRVDEIVGRGP